MTGLQRGEPLRSNPETTRAWQQRSRKRTAEPRKPVDLQRAAELYEAGRSLPAIGRELGCNAGYLSRALRKAGVAMRPPSQHGRTLNEAEVVRRYRAGEGQHAIAADLGVSHQRVRRALRDAGVPVRGSGRVRGVGTGPGGAVAYSTEFDAAKPAVRARSGGRCEAGVARRCTGRGEHVHHRKLRSQGGTNDLANLLDVCQPCHATIHAKPADSYAQGLLVHSWADPAAVPVQL